MAGFWDQGPTQDFNVGGFSPAPVGQPNDPRTMPQAPGSDFGMKDPMKPFPTGLPADATIGTSDQTGQVTFGNGTQGPMTMNDVLQGRLQAVQQQHPAGSLGGNILQAFNNPQFKAFVASHRQTPSTPGMAQAGQVAGQLGQWMQGGKFQPQAPQHTMQSVMGGPILDAMNQNGGFYAPPAMQMGPNGPQQTPGAPPQPMNPSQQSQQTLMQSPDGQHFQYVNQEHVPHYQGLGAQVYNGSSYSGGGS